MLKSDALQVQQKMGAGVIPFALSDNKVFFLFQTTFSGRKTGYLIDFGGGVGSGEDYRSAAIREFVEETETMYFSDDVSAAYRTPETIADQITIVEALFDKTLKSRPDWWCKRRPGDPLRPKRWKTFFVEFPYRDIEGLNREWKVDTSGRFKKRRELVWVAADELLAIYQAAPDRLWKRVRQLENAPAVIDAIRRVKED
jgi:8-oxo-dGTP pyrophosphatase MutT (NUDIX family)